MKEETATARAIRLIREDERNECVRRIREYGGLTHDEKEIVVRVINSEH